jgi:two-component system, OmpR family, response regulator CpxR
MQHHESKSPNALMQAPKTEEASHQKILVVDDDVELCELLSEYLQPEGYQVESVHDGRQGLERCLSGKCALLILDVMLPGLKGFELLRRIRAQSGIPVIMLTAKGDDVDRILGLESGADDYVPKPFNPRELLARIQAVLRRYSAASEAFLPKHARIVLGDVELDSGARSVRCRNRTIELTSMEFDLLALFLKAPGQVIAREEIVTKVLGHDLAPFERSIDVHVSNLRKKLGSTRDGTERIKAIRSVGYVYAMPCQAS